MLTFCVSGQKTTMPTITAMLITVSYPMTALVASGPSGGGPPGSSWECECEWVGLRWGVAGDKAL